MADMLQDKLAADKAASAFYPMHSGAGDTNAAGHPSSLVFQQGVPCPTMT